MKRLRNDGYKYKDRRVQNSNKDKDRRLEEQLKSSINNDDMTEIITELTTKTNEVSSEQLLAVSRRVDAQRTQKALSEATK